jgi:hypothetical protein
MSSPEETLRLPAKKSVTDSEIAYIPKMLRTVDEVLARHSHVTSEAFVSLSGGSSLASEL